MATQKTRSTQVKKTPARHTSASAKAVQIPSFTGKKMTKEEILATLKRPQLFIPVAILLAILVVYLLKSLFVVAIVNGALISRPSFESALEKQGGKQVLNTLVTQILVEQEASKKGIHVNQSDIDAQAKKIDQQLAAQGQTLDQALTARGMTRADFNQQIKLQDMIQKLLANDIKVTDQEVQDYIDKNKDSLPQGQSDAQIKASVTQQLQQEKLSTKAQALIQKLLAQAHISYFVNL